MDKEDVHIYNEILLHGLLYRYTMEYYAAIKMNENTAICSNMDGPRDYHTK